MYKVFFKDCFLGQEDTYSKAVTIAWNYASSINLEFSKEIKQPFGRMTLIFSDQNRKEYFIIAKGE